MLSTLARQVPLLALCCLLPGCLTEMLWEKDVSTPPLVSTQVECQVLDARGQFVTEDGSARLELTYAAQQGESTPIHLWGNTSDQPGRVTLRPPAGRNWLELPGAAIFKPDSWRFRMFRGRYFHLAGVRARMQFEGHLPAQKVGSILKPEEVSASYDDLPPKPIPSYSLTPQEQCLIAFRSTQWFGVLTTTARGHHEQEALTFLDPEGQSLDDAELRALLRLRERKANEEYLRSCTLLVRLHDDLDRTWYARLALPVLLQGPELKLERKADSVSWVRNQVWYGDASATTELVALPPLAIPLSSRRFVYTYAWEGTKPTTLLPTLIKIILTPVTAALDFAWVTSEYYVNALRALGGNRQFGHGPIAPKKD